MGRSRITVAVGSLILTAAMSVLPVENTGAQTPSTSVVIPSDNATVSGSSQVLDAAASSGTTEVQYEITGGSLTDSVIAKATPTIYGWLAKWNTTTVANGTYSLQSVATLNGVSGTSAPITITVNNAPPSTSVIIPTDGFTFDTTTGYVLDAAASPGVTAVSFEEDSVAGPATLAATPTIYGWIVVEPPGPPPCSFCSPQSIPIAFESVASYAGGVTGTSQPVDGTITVYLPQS